MDQKKIMVKARSIVVLIGKEAAGGTADEPAVKKAASPYKTKATKNNRKESDTHVE